MSAIAPHPGITTPASAETRTPGFQPKPNARTAAVIGAGLGGIAAALRLTARGFNTTLIDRLEQPGGRARVFLHQGYTFDAGPTVITAPFLIDELFALFNERAQDHITLTPVDPWYRIQFEDGQTFDYTGDTERTLQQIRDIEPRDVDGYLRMQRKADKIYRVGYEQLGDQPFDRPAAMLRAVPDMLRLGSRHSVYRFAAHHLRNERLRQIFSFQPLLVGGHPFRTPSIYALIQSLERRFGVHYTLGGTGALVHALTDLFQRHGGTLLLNRTAQRINTLRDRVTGITLDDGTTINAQLVVSNAEPAFTYRNLLQQHPRVKRTAARAKRMKQSMGLFVLYFGSTTTYPDLAHHTILLSNRYKPLLDDIFDRGIVPADPSLYVHAPTRTDPAIAPPNRECFYALAPVPNLAHNNDWSTPAADRYRDLVLDRIQQHLAPQLTAHLDTAFYMTPQSFEADYLSPLGAGFSVEPKLTQSAYFRFHNRCPHLQNLFFVGAGTHPGAGIPGVLTSAKTLQRILDREGIAA